MPTIQIDLIEVRQKPNTDNVIITAKSDNRIITREINISEFNTWEQFAEWIINQEPEFVLLPEKEKSLSIDFHLDTETGLRVVDSVTVSP